MNRAHYQKLICLLCILACCGANSACTTEVWSLQVISIEVDGRAVDTVNDVAIIAPGQDKVQMRNLGKGTKIEQGTEIVVPSRTALVLESANGNQVRLQPGSRFKVNVVSSEGETYSLFLGQALFKISQALNFFNVNYQSFLAIVRGTEFEMAVEPTTIRFRLTEGRLVVQRDVKVKIVEGGKVAQVTASEILTQGKETERYVVVQPKEKVKIEAMVTKVPIKDVQAQGRKNEVSYQLEVKEYIGVFNTPDAAVEHFKQQLAADEQSGEYELKQTGLANMGIILNTVGKPMEAIAYFEPALKAALERGDQIWEAGLLNNLGVAFGDMGDFRKAIEKLENALTLELKFFPDNVHPDIAKSYNNLGTAYLGLGDSGKAKTFFNKSRELERKALLRRDLIEHEK